jgi:urease subunit alpha
VHELCLASLEDGIVEKYGLKRMVVPVQGCRTVAKKDMKRNEATPEINADTYEVTVDGEKIQSEPMKELPMTQR